ncbi:hypothetical protein D0X99_18895 [Algoriphagus lacus]|uniref:Uncharacterized protein n=1 Tax=Algoriphagus lacus TaxID=2056311 RepID=A0A418PM37_9BACT|nr:hypothetical protein [Algoriphagus lacus]RIW12580.1 hypothetical protein D0X99_18895 [Algoriphagus lacus]
MKPFSFIFSITLFLIFSCKEKEDPTSNIGKVSITGIELTDSGLPGGRTLASFQWKHVFPSSVQVTFIKTGTGESFSLSLNPNNFSQPYGIDLPFGGYEYTGVTTGPNVSATLPISVTGQLEVSKTSESVVLKARTEYGLVTYSKSNLNNAPKVLEPTAGTLSATTDFYYTYVKSGEVLKTELALSNGKSFRIGINAADFAHRQFQVQASGTGTPDFFQPVDFTVSSELLVLGENGYPSTLLPYSISELPASQSETSGLQWIQGRLFSINDGGNAAEIYELNPQTGALLRTIKVINIPNVDWEDLAASPTHLFIGDFGNNLGTRKDLKILKIPLNSVLTQVEVSAELIEFSYPDQSDFSGTNANHNFDCEAMVFSGNQLHLFSKNLGDLKTKHYSLSANAGKQVAVLEESFDSKGLITGADISADGKIMVLLGYENRGVSSRAFVWTFAPVAGKFFSVPGNQFFLGSPANLSQTEGIAMDPQLELKISGERISFSGLTVPPKLFEVDLGGIFTP